QAEDGIRDFHVTGVQTCALPIFVDPKGIDVGLLKQIKEVERRRISVYAERRGSMVRYKANGSVWDVPCDVALPCATQNELHSRRSEERRVGKESRTRRPTHRVTQ